MSLEVASTALSDADSMGAMDNQLIGSPQITFFAAVYRRHCNFAIESIEQSFVQMPAFGKATSINISSLGDMICGISAEVTFPASDNYAFGVGNALFKSVEVVIGGAVIDVQTSDWLNISSELTVPEGKLIAYDRMVSNYYSKTRAAPFTCRIPFQFWFTKHDNALPILLMQQPIQLRFQFETMENLTNNNLASASYTLDCKIYVDYVFLDTPERQMLTRTAHQQLIEQVQYNEFEIASGSSFYNAKLRFTNAVKELHWVHCPVAGSAYGPLNYAAGKLDLHTFTTGKLVMNTNDRCSSRMADYYYLVQNWAHHQRVPRTQFVHTTYNDSFTVETTGFYRNYIYSYSFALRPDEHQPSGCCNFSKLRTAELQLKYDIASAYYTYNYARILKVFAVVYNILHFTATGVILSLS
jgi:hypothetical protein